jgi:TonB family protein
MIMTFRRSLILSFFLHMFLLGTTFAFARYAGGLFQVLHEPTMVMLVGKEGSSATDGEARKTPKGSPDRSEQKKLPSLLKQAPENISQLPADSSSQQDHNDSVQQESDARTAQQKAQEGAGYDEESIPDNGLAAGSPAGSVSSEQWAVIVSSLERVKNYPRLARERGIEGIVRLRFHVRSQGEVDHVEIVKSSGYEILDTASVRTVYRAAPMPYVSGWVEVPIAYILK